MEYPMHLMAAAMLGAIGAACAWGAIASALRARSLSTARPVSCSADAPGYVRVTGRAAPTEEALRSPATGQPCVWYHMEISQQEYVGKVPGDRFASSTRSRVVDVQRSTAPFWLEDGSGRVLIDPQRISFETPNRVQMVFWGPSLRPQRKVSRDDSIGVGDTITAFGKLHAQGGGAAARVAEILKEWKQDPAAMKQFDADGDGRVDAREWEQARAAAHRKAKAALGGEASTRVLSSPGDGRPVVVTAGSYGDLVDGLSKQKWVFGGLAVVFLCAAVWQWRAARYAEEHPSPVEDPLERLRPR